MWDFVKHKCSVQQTESLYLLCFDKMWYCTKEILSLYTLLPCQNSSGTRLRLELLRNANKKRNCNTAEGTEHTYVA